MKKSDFAMVFIFCGYISSFFVINSLKSDEKFSEQENRSLQQRPEFSFETLLSGEFSEKYEKYVTDQFAFRDNFVEIKSSTENLLGKMENNNVYISTENTLIDKYPDPNYTQIDTNLKNVNNFAQAVDIPVNLVLYPTQNDIYKHKLPKNAPTNSQKEVIDYVYDGFIGNTTINVYDKLMSKNDEYIYYNTDHHWTSLGAFYAYEEIIKTLNQEPVSLDKYEKTTLSDSFNGTIYSSSGIRFVKSDEIDIYAENTTIAITDADGIRYADMYDISKLENKDQYEVYLGGNHSIVTIKGKGDGKLLILKDSYTNCQVPFLIENYAEIHLVDLRFCKMPMSTYIMQNRIDEVLVAYAVTNFTTDTNLVFLK